MSLLVVALAFFMINKRKPLLKSSKINCVVFYGPSWSSKTKLWNILFMDKRIESITSMEIKEGFVNNEQQDIKIVDFPSQTVFES